MFFDLLKNKTPTHKHEISNNMHINIKDKTSVSNNPKQKQFHNSCTHSDNRF